MAEIAVEDGSYGVGGRVDGVDTGGAVGLGFVAQGGEVHFPLEVVAAVGIDVGEAWDLGSRDGVGFEIKNGDVSWGLKDCAREPDLWIYDFEVSSAWLRKKESLLKSEMCLRLDPSSIMSQDSANGFRREER